MSDPKSPGASVACRGMIWARTDVLDACPKAEGMMMMIRSMSPDVLVVDEIGNREDSQAVHEAGYTGIRLFVTVHGQSQMNAAAARSCLS